MIKRRPSGREERGSMSVVDKYIDYVKEEAMKRPEKSWNKILLGFQANKWRMRLLPTKDLSKGYQKLEQMMMGVVADSLSGSVKKFVSLEENDSFLVRITI